MFRTAGAKQRRRRTVERGVEKGGHALPNLWMQIKTFLEEDGGGKLRVLRRNWQKEKWRDIDAIDAIVASRDENEFRE